jgi:hypothetical protein
MEESLFPLPAVAGELSKLIEARLHYDGSEKKAVKALQKSLVQSYAAPIYVIVDPKTGSILRRHDGVASESEFLKFLRGS